MSEKYKSFSDLPYILDAATLAEVFGVSRTHIYKMMHSRGFPLLKVGKRLLVSKEDLKEWMDEKVRTQNEEDHHGIILNRWRYG